MKAILDIFGSNMPLIGYGPGSIGYAHARNKYDKYGRLIGGVYHKIWKHYLKHVDEKHYVDIVAKSLQSGFRILDYSCAYGDGRLIGEAIAKCGIDRKELFITTRVSNYAQREHIVRDELLSFLNSAKLEYVDLLQFHWPVTDFYLDTWREMEKLYEEGYVKHLGVANCHVHHLEEIFKICKYPPEVGQFEIHPLFTQKPLIEYYKKHDILVEAYTPIARFDDRLMRLPLLKNMAQKYGKSVPQIILRWHVQNEVVPLVRTMNIKHVADNLNIYDFELTEEEMKAIDGVNINSRLRYDPDNCDFSIL